MSEFVYKSKVAALELSNSQLMNEISDLKITLRDLNGEIERLRRQNPDDITILKEKLTDYERREEELREQILTILKNVKNRRGGYDVVNELISVMKFDDIYNLEKEIEKYYKKKLFPKIVISFMIGIMVSLIFCIFVDSLKSDTFHSEIIHKFINNMLQRLS